MMERKMEYRFYSVPVNGVIRYVLLVALLLAGMPQSHAEQDTSVDRLLIDSGIDAQMPVFEKMVNAALEQNPGLEQEEREVLQHIAMESLRPEVIYDRVRMGVERVLQPGDRETLLLWFSSPLGQRITQLELQGLEDGVLPALKAAAPALLADKERMQAASRLDGLMQATVLGLKLQEKAMQANHIAVEIAAHPNAAVDTAALEAQLEEHREPLLQLMQQQTLLSLAFTYRDLPAEKLASYESFLSTSAAQRYQQGIQTGLLAGVDVVLQDWESGVRDYYQTEKATP